jgi:hypothetical protein
MSCNLFQEDQERFDEFRKAQEGFHNSAIKLFGKELDLVASRGHPDRRKSYRRNVLNWIKENSPKGKRSNDDHYVIEYTFDVNKTKKRKVVYLDAKTEIPENVLQSAFLSGEDNRLLQKQIVNDEEIFLDDSNNILNPKKN